jgi:hypothetical protein
LISFPREIKAFCVAAQMGLRNEATSQKLFLTISLTYMNQLDELMIRGYTSLVNMTLAMTAVHASGIKILTPTNLKRCWLSRNPD